MDESTVGNGGSTSTGSEGTTSSMSSTSSSSSSEGSALASLERAAASSTAETGSPASALGARSDGQAGAAGTESGTSAGGSYHVPPREEWERILNNARSEATKPFEWVRQLGDNVDPNEVMQLLNVARRLYADPQAFARDLMEELGQGQQEEEELVDPEPDYQSEDGKSRFFSEKSLRTLLKNQESRLMRQFRPAMDLVSREEQREQVRTMMAEAKATATQALQVASKLPHFEEYKADIAKELSQVDPQVRRQVGSVAALYMAYNKVLAEKVFPKIGREAEDKVREGFKRSATTSVGQIKPGQGAEGKPKPLKDGDVDGLAAHMANLARSLS